jgi:large subunit ribosomal protein L7/L12
VSLQDLASKEAKEVVDGAPKMVKEGADKATADDIKAKLEEVGAKVTLK